MTMVMLHEISNSNFKSKADKIQIMPSRNIFVFYINILACMGNLITY